MAYVPIYSNLSETGLFYAITVNSAGSFSLGVTSRPAIGSVLVLCILSGPGIGLQLNLDVPANIYSWAIISSQQFNPGAVPLYGYASGAITSIIIDPVAGTITAGAFSTTINALFGTANPPLPPITGSLVFGAQANVGFPTYANANGFNVTAGYENLLTETYLSAQPINWRMIWANGWGITNGIPPIEDAPANASAISWGSLFTSSSGASFIGDIPYTKYGLALAAGGFTISDPLPAVAAASIARHVITTTLGGFRASGYNFTKIGEAQRRSATLSTFTPVRTANAGTSAGSAIFNNEAVQAAGIVIPRPSGYRSFLMMGTSIMRIQDATYRFLDSTNENTYGYFPLGLHSSTNVAMGWWQAAINGANIAQQDQNIPGSFAQRYAIIAALARENGNRWPFSDIAVDLRNDLVLINGTDATDTLNQWVAVTILRIAEVKALFPGIPVHLIDMPPIQSSANFGTFYYTDTANQIPTVGNFKAAAVLLWNAYIVANKTALGIASVCPAGSGAIAPDDGSNVAKWLLTPYTLAGGGTLNATANLGDSMVTTGIVVSSVAQPELGTYIIIEPGVANAEAVGQSGSSITNGWITSVVTAGTNLWTIKVAGTGVTVNLTKTHLAGSVVKTAATQDGTHPSHWAQQTPMCNNVITWKGTI